MEKGDRVSMDVVWPNGRTSTMVGELLLIDGDEAYIKTELGPVVGDASTLESLEDD